MELADILHQMAQQSFNALQPCDLCIGTVTKTSPLEITIDTAMAPLKSSVLYLTESVVEKKGYLEKMVVFDLSSRFKSKSTLFLLVVFCSITGILY